MRSGWLVSDKVWGGHWQCHRYGRWARRRSRAGKGHGSGLIGDVVFIVILNVHFRDTAKSERHAPHLYLVAGDEKDAAGGIAKLNRPASHQQPLASLTKHS